MKIEVTEKEYQTLIEMLYLATWVISAYDTETQPDKQEYEDLEQKFLAYAKDFGMDRFVVWDEELGQYYPTREFEEGRPTELIEEFEEETFWDELINRLGKRDFMEKYTEAEIEKMEVVERIHKIDQCAEKYEEEFGENGLANLRIDKKIKQRRGR